jgi:hypothetical protein
MTTHQPRSLHDQAGLIGKVALMWIVVLLVVGLLVLDGISIVLTTFNLSSAAQGAASAAATSYHNLPHDEAKACEAAGVELLQDNVSIPTNDGWCKIDPTSGQATISLKSTASSLVLGRLSFTRDLTKVEVKEDATPAL